MITLRHYKPGEIILKVLFEHLRKANLTISQLRAVESKHTQIPAISQCMFSTKTKTNISMEGLTRAAVKALPKNPFQIKKLPFLIGRKTQDPLAYNDLAIKDKLPYRVSRHHIELDKHENKISVLDRGSSK